jgi:hypothetical protein
VLVLAFGLFASAADRMAVTVEAMIFDYSLVDLLGSLSLLIDLTDLRVGAARAA